jgi:hypothetical protein
MGVMHGCWGRGFDASWVQNASNEGESWVEEVRWYIVLHVLLLRYLGVQRNLSVGCVKLGKKLGRSY